MNEEIKPKPKRRQLPAEPLPVKKIKLLVTVVNKNKAEFYTDLLQSFEINMQMVMRAYGTAGSEMLHYMGLEESEKTVIFSFVREDQAPAALAALDEKFRTLRGGKGIAYTVPISGVIGAAIYQFLSNQHKKGKGDSAQNDV